VNTEITTWGDFRKRFLVLPTGCWEWLGDQYGAYGKAFFEGRHEGAHNIGFIVMRGGKNPEMVRDHFCRYRLCVNPFHLEEVSNAENLARGRRARGRQTH
jgi:hypothetical protein